VETGAVEEAVDDSVEEAVAGGETAGRGGREREHEEGEESEVRGIFPFFAWGELGQRMDSAWLSCEPRFELHN
jgi:hypothetical protein